MESARKRAPKSHAMHAAIVIAAGFALIILAGTLLLMLPFAAKSGRATPFLDALFTATSATCVTGLVTVSTALHWSFFGKCVILLLIQIGGLGFMSVMTAASLLVRRTITLRERMVIGAGFGLDSNGGIVRLMRRVLVGTFLFEGVGAALLSVRFVGEFGLLRGIGMGIFHAVSAFCNGGFDLMGTPDDPFCSLVGYAGDPLVSLTIMALIVMVLNAGMLPEVLRRIFQGAFDFKAIFGGAAGFGSSALMQGIKRGLYSNEAGVGSAPNAAAAADVSHPVKQGLVQMLSVFIDTILVCSATAMMCLCTGIEPSESLKGAPFVQASLEHTFGVVGPYFITIALLLFAFTTLLGNLFYCEGCLNYIAGRTLSHRQMNVFHAFACVVVFVGAQMKFGLVWDIADVLMGIMALINLPVILRLGGTAMHALSDYMKQRHEGKDPVVQAKNIGLKEQTDYWN